MKKFAHWTLFHYIDDNTLAAEPPEENAGWELVSTALVLDRLFYFWKRELPDDESLPRQTSDL